MRRSLLRGGLGIAISVVSLYLVLRQVDLAAVGRVLGSAAPGWVAGVMACIAIDVLCRTVRWQGLLAPIQRVRFVPVLGYLLVGYLANNVLPARLGELVRSHYLGDRENLSRATTLGTIVVERVVDTAVLVAIASAAILLLHVRGVVASAVLVGLGITGLLIVGLAAALVAHRLPYADRAVTAVERWPTVISLAGRLRGGLAVAGRPRTVAVAVAWSLVAWSATVVGVRGGGPGGRRGAHLGPGRPPGRGRLARHRDSGGARLPGNVRAGGGADRGRLRGRRGSRGRAGRAGPRGDPRPDLGRWGGRAAPARVAPEGRGGRYGAERAMTYVVAQLPSASLALTSSVIAALRGIPGRIRLRAVVNAVATCHGPEPIRSWTR